MNKLSQKRVRKKLVDQVLDRQDDSSMFSKINKWYASDDADFEGISSSLAYLGFKILKNFVVDDDESLKAVFLLCLTPESHECLVIVPFIECYEGIVVQSDHSDMVPFDIKNNFTEKLKNSKTALAFLTHNGIDGIGNCGNYSFDDQEMALKSLKRGVKFYMPIPLIDYDDLVSVQANNNIGTFVKQSSETTTFTKMLYKVGMENLLEGDGPYTVFVPTNQAIRQAGYGTLMEGGNEPELKAFILNHIFLGSHDKTYKGKLMSLQGNEYNYQKDLVSCAGCVSGFSKANGFVTLSDKVLSPPSFTENADVQISMSETISTDDIAQTSYDIWKTQDAMDRDIREQLKEHLSLIGTAITIQEDLSKTEMLKVGQKIVQLDDLIQDVLYESEVTINGGENFSFVSDKKIMTKLSSIKEDLAKNNAEYGEYMKTSYRLAALKYLLAVAAKIARDA